MKKVLIDNELGWPFSLVVNPLIGWLYWADSWYNQITRTSLDGSRKEIILDIDIYHPRGLALDVVENRLYWSQKNRFSSIWSSNVDGLDKRMIFTATHSQLPYGQFPIMTVFDQFIYMVDLYPNVVYKVSKCNGEELEAVYNSTRFILDIKMYHSAMQPEGENLCSKRIDQCSHFCFPTPASPNNEDSAFTTTCACPDGLHLSSDQQNCVSELTMLMPVKLTGE